MYKCRIKDCNLFATRVFENDNQRMVILCNNHNLTDWEKERLDLLLHNE